MECFSYRLDMPYSLFFAAISLALSITLTSKGNKALGDQDGHKTFANSPSLKGII